MNFGMCVCCGKGVGDAEGGTDLTLDILRKVLYFKGNNVGWF